MEYDLHDIAYKSYMEDSAMHYKDQATYIKGFIAGYKLSIPLATEVDVKTADIDKKYHELLLAVERKFPTESRHQTALRYIQEAAKGAKNDKRKNKI